MIYQRQTSIDYARAEVDKELPVVATNDKGEAKSGEEKK